MPDIDPAAKEDIDPTKGESAADDRERAGERCESRRTPTHPDHQMSTGCGKRSSEDPGGRQEVGRRPLHAKHESGHGGCREEPWRTPSKELV